MEVFALLFQYVLQFSAKVRNDVKCVSPSLQCTCFMAHIKGRKKMDPKVSYMVGFSESWRGAGFLLQTSPVRSQSSCEINRTLNILCYVNPVCLFLPGLLQTTFTQFTIALVPRPFPEGKISQEAIQQNLTQCSPCKSKTNPMCTEAGQRKGERAFINANQCALKPQGWI